ncbi:MAG: methyl-accepting chemotaxis protein, partial [Proteobacteria bacterium]
MNAQGSFLGKISVGRKMAILPALFILGAAITLIYTVTTLQGQDDDSFMIDIASRQRLLNEQYLRQTILASTGRAVERDGLKHVLDESALAMINGGSVVARLGTADRRDIDSAPNDLIRASIETNRQQFFTVEKSAEEYLSVPKGTSNTAALDKLMRASAEAEEGMKSTVKNYVRHFEHRAAVMIQWELAIFALVAIAGIYLSWLLSRSIINPLEAVVKMAQGIAAGDLRQEKLTIVSEDEIGKLGVVFNDMMDSLRDLAGQSISISKNLGSAAAEVLASVQQQAAATKEQAASVQQTTTTMEEISQSGSQIAERARQVAGVAEASSGVSSAGVTAVQGTNTSMVSIREQVESVAENIVTLSERNQAIAEIIATVNDIAEQTNLLALNAAIEAAAAGD